MTGRGRGRSRNVGGSARGRQNPVLRPSIGILNFHVGRRGLDHPAPSTLDSRDILRDRMLEAALARGEREDEDEHDDEGEDDDQDEADEEERVVVTPGASISSVGNTTVTKPSWSRPLNWKKRGRSKMAKVPTHRQIAEYGKHHFFTGSIRTLMSCIYKAYCPGAYHSWKQWKMEDKLLCWEKFKQYFIFKEDENEEKVREIFEAYGKANWCKFLYKVREEAKKENKHYRQDRRQRGAGRDPGPPNKSKITKDQNAKSPVEWLSDSQWRELCHVWSAKSWRQKAKKARNNRTDKKSKLVISTCGNKPLEQRVYEERDPSTGDLPDQLRMFEIGHKKRDGEWSTPRAKEIGEGYKKRLDAIADEIVSSTGSARPSYNQLDPDLRVYTDVTGRPNKKGQWVGFGRSYSAPSWGSSKDSADYVEMRAHMAVMEKDLNHERSCREQLEKEQVELREKMEREQIKLREEMEREKIELRQRQEETEAKMVVMAAMVERMTAMESTSRLVDSERQPQTQS